MRTYREDDRMPDDLYSDDVAEMLEDRALELEDPAVLNRRTYELEELFGREVEWWRENGDPAFYIDQGGLWHAAWATIYASVFSDDEDARASGVQMLLGKL